MANKKISELDSRASLGLSDLMVVGDPSTGYAYKTTLNDVKSLVGSGVNSFNGRIGAVVPAEGDYNLDQLGDVVITTPASGQLIRYNGTNWANWTPNYLTAESDTLDSVTGRGSVTANVIRIGGIYATAGATTIFNSEADYFFSNRISSSGTQGFKIKGYGTDASFWRYNDGTGNIEFGNAQNYGLNLYTNNVPVVYVHADGNVGIGTGTNAAFKLDVFGTTRLNGNTTVTGVLTGSDTIRSTNGTVTVSLSYGSTAGIIGTTSNHALEIRTNNVYRIGVNTSGVVNIANLSGTGSRMVVADAAGNLSAQSFTTGTVTSVGLTSATSGITITGSPVTASGNLNFEIATASGSQNGLLSSTDWNTFNNKQNALTNPITGTGTTNYLPKFTGPSALGNSLIFDNGTTVGVNTATPSSSYKFDVNGLVRVGNISIDGSYTNNTLIGRGSWSSITSDFNTYIGSLSGQSTTTGYANTYLGSFTGGLTTTGIANTFLGYQAGFYHTTGTGNTLIGVDAGYRVIDTNYTTIIGYHTGQYVNKEKTLIIGADAASDTLYNGDMNTIVGYAAGYQNRNGSYNTFLGNKGGYGVRNGSNNVMIGFEAANAISDASNNTIIGYRSGYSITSGSELTFIGALAGFSNTTGLYNTFIGYDSGRFTSSGSTNTSIGYRALYSSTTGYNITSIGAFSSFSLTTGSQSVHIGTNGGRTITTGTFNVFIGENAGFNASQKVDASNSIAIGYATFTTKNNQVVLGNTSISETILNGSVLIGSQSNSGQALQVTGTGYFSNNVSIGATSASYRLDVVGTGIRTAPTTGSTGQWGAFVIGSTLDATAQYFDAFRISGTGAGGYASNNTSIVFQVWNGSSWNTQMAINQGSGGVGIGATSLLNYGLRISKNIQGAATSYAAAVDGLIQSGVTTSASSYYSGTGTQAASFSLTEINHFYAVQGTFGAGSTVTNQYGFRVHASLVGATNDYGFFGDIASGTGRWNFYAQGTALNYMAGALLLGNNVSTGEQLQVTGDTKMTGEILLSDSKTSIVNGDYSANFSKVYTPTSTQTNVNSYGFVSNVTYNLASGTYIGSETYNAAASFAQAVITGNATTKATQPIRAYMAGLVGRTTSPAMNIADFRFFDIKSPDADGVAGHVVDNIYGLKIGTMKGASSFTVTNGWGIYQEGANDNNYFNGSVGVGTASPTAFLDVKAATTSAASLRLRSGTAPTTPNDGDIWFDGTNLKMRIGGVTKTFTIT